MASAADQKADAGRLLLLIPLVSLAVVSAAGFSRVFEGDGPGVKLGVAAVCSSLLAVALERRHVLLAALASAAGLAVAVGLLIFPDTTWLALPTAATWHAAVHALGAVGRTAQVQPAPAFPLDPLLLAGLTAVWTAAFASHALAVRARSPFLALLPPVSLLAFAGIVVDDGVRPAYVVVFLASALGVLFADSLRRVGQWGPVTLWHGRGRLRFGSVTTTRAARRVAVACLGIAAFAPWLLPGFRHDGLLKINGEQGQHVSIDPIVDIRPALLSTRPFQLFTVQAEHPAYWRFLSLDRFDGRRWTASNLQATGGEPIADSFLPAAEGSAPPSGTTTIALEQRFHFDGLAQPWLPAAYDPVHITVQSSVVRYDPGSQLLVSPNGTFRGFTYDVRSTEVVPTPEQLDTVIRPTDPASHQYTKLPADTPKEIIDIAHRLTDGQPTMYRKALAIQDYLRNNFRYDIRVPPGHDTNQIIHFLTKSKAGYCEQFAGSMAVLLRALGIPTRVAVGFTPGTLQGSQDVWHVTQENAHAWVEVLFPGYGWLAFEPTPTRTNPVATPYTAPPANGGVFLGGLPGRCTTEANTRVCLDIGSKGRLGGNAATRKRVGDPLSEGLGARRSTTSPGPRPVSVLRRWRTPAAMTAVVLVVLVGLAIPASKVLSRRTALRRARRPEDRVLAAYRVMTDRAADLGLGPFPAETIHEYRHRLRTRVAEGNGHLDLLTDLTVIAAYAQTGVSARQATEAMAASRSVTADIRRAVGPGRRLVGMFRWRREPGAA